VSRLIICGPDANSESFARVTPATSATTGDRVPRGIAFALVSFAIFSCADAAVKWLSARHSIFQIIFVSTLIALVAVAALLRREGGLAALRPRHPWLVTLRALLLAADVVFAFFAFARLPLADAYAMLFTAPILVTILSVPLLGERVGWRRWTAVAVGFGGVLVALRPGFAELDLGHVAALVSSLFFALSLIVARRIGNSESGSLLLLSMMIALLAVSAPALPAVYVASAPADLAVLAGIGLLMGLAHLGLIQALRFAPSGVVAPFHYSQIVWGVVFGLLLFGDRPDLWVVVGSMVIVGSGLYILWRETVRGRQAIRAPASATLRPPWPWR
jgi:S-adenosylmethionine uptake transporter